MGLEADCTLRQARRVVDGRARLEEKHLLFRGAELSLKLPIGKLTNVEARGGWLRVRWPQGEADFALGAQAERWAQRILKPPGLMDKLGVKPGARVSALGVPDAGLRDQLEARGAEVSTRLRNGSDIVLAYFEARDDLRRLPALRDALQPGGAVWALWRKGRKELREDDVRQAALPLGLVDVKVASVSDALSGLKLMIRRERR